MIQPGEDFRIARAKPRRLRHLMATLDDMIEGASDECSDARDARQSEAQVYR